ncbi:hypothetical protein RhiirC2_718161 [Rhizophagus irregularis]|uniref:Uncharacterized protein n=1 Tax=Rhizophagus irregularis TaxID=588596 RepID=A0A2N1MJI6_9GLOM|nr:hypothetical protein RhiirC2_718161 [Rhizophagus irregularis]
MKKRERGIKREGEKGEERKKGKGKNGRGKGKMKEREKERTKKGKKEKMGEERKMKESFCEVSDTDWLITERRSNLKRQLWKGFQEALMIKSRNQDNICSKTTQRSPEDGQKVLATELIGRTQEIPVSRSA